MAIETFKYIYSLTRFLFQNPKCNCLNYKYSTNLDPSIYQFTHRRCGLLVKIRDNEGWWHSKIKLNVVRFIKDIIFNLINKGIQFNTSEFKIRKPLGVTRKP